MINTIEIKVAYLLKNKSAPSNLTNDQITKYITPYLYPAAAICANIVQGDTVYMNSTSESNFSYLLNFTSSIYTNIYNETERNIIALFLTCSAQNLLDSFLVEKIERILSYNTELVEINYLIEELKYKLASYYISQNTNSNRILQLINELDSIEESHNAINLYDKNPEI